MTAARNDPQAEIKRIIGALPTGHKRLWIWRDLFDRVCRAYAIAPRQNLAGVQIQGVEVRPFDFVDVR